MYDIKIFDEEDWTFWARIKAWKEIIYWIWNIQDELMEDMKEWLNYHWNSVKVWEKASVVLDYLKKIRSI